MIRIYTLMLMLIAGAATAQISTTDEIAEAEMKSASSLTNLAVNPNTLNYDITYHQLQFTVDPAVYFINGIVTTTFTALSNMQTITFDLNNSLTVSQVMMNGSPLTFSQNNNKELIINFPAAVQTGSSATVVIYYSGPPGTGENAFTSSTHAGTPIIYTLSEPFGARDWWPCKQDLNDKADLIDVYITAPSQYVSVSNGLEQSQVINGNQKTTHYRHTYPIPAYLVAIAVTNYSIFTQQAGTAPNNFPIVNYIYPENLASAQESLSVTLPIMNLFESLFEPYPFSNEKYGHAQFNFGGGMEHSTVSFMGGFSRNLIAHELAHQWFGDKITCGTWNDIWLNEGFAEYLSGLVIENLDGDQAFTDWKLFKKFFITSQPGGSVYVPEEQVNSVSRIFSSRLSYNKGAMVLHMLRFKLGDAVFFQGVKNYLADPELAYAFAVTDDLQFHLEAASGVDLEEYFADWVYGEGFPIYNVTVQNINDNKAKIVIYQGQSHPSVDFFEMPVPVTLFGDNGAEATFILNNDSDIQEFIVDVPFVVTDIAFDRKNDILSGGNIASLDVKGFDVLQSVKISPNPVSSILEVFVPLQTEIVDIAIFNILGQKLLSGKEPRIGVGQLPNGVHLISITTNDGIKQLKFVKN